MKASLFAICTLCVTVSHAQTSAYKWVDENGLTHFTANPPPTYITESELLQYGKYRSAKEMDPSVKQQLAEDFVIYEQYQKQLSQNTLVNYDQNSAASSLSSDDSRCASLQDKEKSLLAQMRQGYTESQSRAIKKKHRELRDAIQLECW
ncbi:MAG: DUF4124 domain-containing protein [Pseudomonadales bacterium]